MFDSDAALIDAITAGSRAESAAAAARLAAIGELYERRSAEWGEDRTLWVADPFEAVAAEVSAALRISRGRAGAQVHHARALRERLPRVAAVFAEGRVDWRIVAAVIHRTFNVDDAVIGEVDGVIAVVGPRWMRFSGPKLADRIDAVIARVDPDGVRVPPEVEKSRYVEVEATAPGMAGISAHVHAPDAAAFDARLDALAATVCPADPRTRAQRRADAVGALAAGAQRMLCGCGQQDCPAIGGSAAPVVITVLAEQATLDGTGSGPGYLPGFGIQPAETVRAAARTATVRTLTPPGADPEPGYRPSAGLAAFVRWRDLSCRWPGCDAAIADIDHTVPHPAGPTQASNCKGYCRIHHLIKTFFTGPGGWSDAQDPDGAVRFTAPTGHTYTTVAGGAELFPALGAPTGVVAAGAGARTPAANRCLAMPLRRRTREEDRHDRVSRERARRAELDDLTRRQHDAEQRRRWEASASDPPPF